MIEFQSVYKYYGDVPALEDVNLHIDDGEFVFILGASGAGKSTFLKLIQREETPTSGEVTVNHIRLSRLKHKNIPNFRRTMGIVFQDFKLIPSMTVFDNVAFPMHVVGAPRKKIRRRVREALDTVGLPDKGQRMPASLSGGEQQRVALARALVNIDDPHHACRLIVADEPTGNVDPQMAYEIIQLLSQINQKYHITVLMITHAHDLVRQFKHRVITLDKGRIVADTGRPRRTGAVSLGAIAAEMGGGEG